MPGCQHGARNELSDVVIPIVVDLRDLQSGGRPKQSPATARVDVERAGLSKAELWPTERRGHAMELGRRAAASGFEIVAAAGGDGTVHEVANGVLQAERPDGLFRRDPPGLRR